MYFKFLNHNKSILASQLLLWSLSHLDRCILQRTGDSAILSPGVTVAKTNLLLKVNLSHWETQAPGILLVLYSGKLKMNGLERPQPWYGVDLQDTGDIHHPSPISPFYIPLTSDEHISWSIWLVRWYNPDAQYWGIWASVYHILLSSSACYFCLFTSEAGHRSYKK